MRDETVEYLREKLMEQESLIRKLESQIYELGVTVQALEIRVIYLEPKD